MPVPLAKHARVFIRPLILIVSGMASVKRYSRSTQSSVSGQYSLLPSYGDGSYSMRERRF